MTTQNPLMKLLSVSVAVCAGAMIAGSAFAQTTGTSMSDSMGARSDAPAATDEQAGPVRDQDNVRSAKLICKVDRVTGTRLHKVKICRTAKEWRDIRRGWQRETKFMTDRGAAASQGERPGAGG
jgi:hypothetical protein